MMIQGVLCLSIALVLCVAVWRQLKQNISEIEKSEIEDKLEQQKSENAQLVDIIENRRVMIDFKILGD